MRITVFFIAAVAMLTASCSRTTDRLATPPELDAAKIKGLTANVKWSDMGTGSSGLSQSFDIATQDLAKPDARRIFMRALQQHLRDLLEQHGCTILDSVHDNNEFDTFTILFAVGNRAGAFTVTGFEVRGKDYWVRVQSMLAKP